MKRNILFAIFFAVGLCVYLSVGVVRAGCDSPECGGGLPSCGSGYTCRYNCCEPDNPPPPPPPTATPTPGSGGGSCDSGCGTCGYRNGNGSCSTSNSCCHRRCGGTSCQTVFGSGSNSCDSSSDCQASCTTPGTPTNTSSSCNSSLRYTVSWSSVSGATSYALRCNDTSDGWSCNNPNDFCIDVTGTSYSFNARDGATIGCWVHARNACGDLGGAAGIASRTCSSPAAPSGASQSCVSASQSRFSWNAVSGAGAYILRVNKSPGSDWMGPGDLWKCISGTSTTQTIAANSQYNDWSVTSSNSTCSVDYGRTNRGGFICNTATPTPSCSCTPWSSSSCGGGSCNDTTMQEVRLCNPLNCNTQSRCVASPFCAIPTATPTPTSTPTPTLRPTATPTPPPSCSCGGWVNGPCGGACPSGQRIQTRSCSPNLCTYEAQCVNSSACVPTPTPTSRPTATPTPRPGATATPTPVTQSCNLNLVPGTATIDVGQTLDLAAFVTNIRNGAIQDVRFSVGDGTIASISDARDSSSPYTTSVTGVANGTTTVRARGYMGGASTCSDTMTVTVNQVIPVCSNVVHNSPSVEQTSEPWYGRVRVTGSDGATCLATSEWSNISDPTRSCSGVDNVCTAAVPPSSVPPPPAVPQCSSPALCGRYDGGDGNDWSWAAVPGATEYHIQVDNDSDFSSPEYDELITDTSFASPAVSIDWTWRRDTSINQYQVRVQQRIGGSWTTLPDYNFGWRSRSNYGCGPSSTCSLTSVHPQGTYRIGVRSRNTSVSNTCTESSWRYSSSVTLTGCSGSGTASCSISVDDISVSEGESVDSIVTINSEVGGTIAQVDFASGDSGIASVTTPDTTPVFSTTISGNTIGNTTYTATATMNDGDTQCVDTANLRTSTPYPWWQAESASVITNGSINSDIPSSCILPICNPFLTYEATGSSGVPLFQGTSGYGAGAASPLGWEVGSSFAGVVQDYDYYRSRLQSGINPAALGSSVSASELESGGTVSGGYQWYEFDGSSGAMTITEDVDVAGRRVVVFVNGDVNIQGDINLIDGVGFFLLVASGDITIDPNVAGPADGSPEIEGIYSADGTLITGSLGDDLDSQLHIRGAVVAGNVSLDRDLVDNSDTPAELFEFGADQVLRFPDQIGSESITWREIAP